MIAVPREATSIQSPWRQNAGVMPEVRIPQPRAVLVIPDVSGWSASLRSRRPSCARSSRGAYRPPTSWTTRSPSSARRLVLARKRLQVEVVRQASARGRAGSASCIRSAGRFAPRPHDAASPGRRSGGDSRATSFVLGRRTAEVRSPATATLGASDEVRCRAMRQPRLSADGLCRGVQEKEVVA